MATEVAARGLDIKELPHVVNYELPNVPEDYVHRIGRTARAGSTGAAVSLVSPDELSYLRDIEKLLKRKIDFVEPPKFEIKEGTHTPPGSAQRAVNTSRTRIRAGVPNIAAAVAAADGLTTQAADATGGGGGHRRWKPRCRPCRSRVVHAGAARRRATASAPMRRTAQPRSRPRGRHRGRRPCRAAVIAAGGQRGGAKRGGGGSQRRQSQRNRGGFARGARSSGGRSGGGRAAAVGRQQFRRRRFRA